MSKTVNVKVAKGVLLAALNEALDRKVKEKADAEKAEKDYAKAADAFKKSIPALIKSGKLKIKTVNFHEWRGEYELNAAFDTKGVKFPQRVKPEYCEWQNKAAQEELQNAIRVLELSADEFVRTSSYAGVSKYL